MITIEPLTSNWQDDLTEYSKMELAMFPKEQLQNLELSQVRLNDQIILIGGLLRLSLLSTPHIILLLCNGFRPRAHMTRALMSYLDEVAPICETLIQTGYQRGERLAGWWGFQKTSRTFKFNQLNYTVYRRRAWRS